MGVNRYWVFCYCVTWWLGGLPSTNECVIIIIKWWYVIIQHHILWRDVYSGTCDNGSLLVGELSPYCPRIYMFMSGCLDVSWAGQMCCSAQVFAKPGQARYITVHSKHNTDYTICSVDWWVWISTHQTRVVVCKVQTTDDYYNLIGPHSEEFGHDF